MLDLQTRQSVSIKNAWLYFIYYWIIFLVGTFLGQFVPANLRFAVSMFILVLIIVTLFVKSTRKFSFAISNILAIALGIVSYGSFAYYLSNLGPTVFYQGIGMAVAGFALFGAIGYFVVKDASGWNRLLFPMLCVLILMSVIGIFIKIPMLVLIISIFSMFVFLMYTIYDFNRMRLGNFTAQEMGFNLFINLLNIIMDVLNLLNYFKN